MGNYFLFLGIGILVVCALITFINNIAVPQLRILFNLKVKDEVSKKCIEEMCELFDEKYKNWIKINEPKIVAKKLMGLEAFYEFRIRKNDIDGYYVSTTQQIYLIESLRTHVSKYIRDKGHYVIYSRDESWDIKRDINNPTMI